MRKLITFILAPFFLSVLLLIFISPSANKLQAQAIGAACPAGSISNPYGQMINPATGKLQQLLCMDANGNLNLPAPSNIIVTNPSGAQTITTPNTAATPLAINAGGNSETAIFSSSMETGNALFATIRTGNGKVQIGPGFSSGVHLITGGTATDMVGIATCSSSTVTVTFGSSFGATPFIFLSDETTSGGARVSAKSASAFTVTCTGASDVVDYFVLGNS